MSELAGTTAVVTGSSTGIGRAIALRLARSGSHIVVCTNKSLDEAQVVADQIKQLGVRAQVARADLREFDEVQQLVEQAWNWNGRVDTWVNNAGADVLTGSMAEATFQEKLQLLLDVDVTGTISCAKLIGQRMQASGAGNIVNLGWDQAWQGMDGDSGEMFAAVKGAVMAFTKSLAKSLAPQVRVNCVAPGWIKTAWGSEASEYWQQRAVAESLLQRWGTPEDVAEAVHYLVSPSASFINGQILPVNGGFRTGPARR